MSTPSGDPENPWTQPGDPARPVAPSTPSGYGTPSSPSYGKYGQGTALPTPPPQPPADPNAPSGQPFSSPRPQWGQPGYTPPPVQRGPAPGAPTTLQPIGALGPATIVLSVVLAVGLVVAAGFAPNQNQYLRDTLNGVVDGSEPPGDGGYNTISSLALLVEIGVWVTVCLWLTRIRQNVVVLGQYDRRRSDVWVWLGWVIPVVNFWFPQQVVGDAIKATAAAAGVPPIRTGPWWTAWLGSLVIGVVLAVSNVLPPNDTMHLVLMVVDAVVVLIALVLWLRIVRWLTHHHDQLMAGR